MSATPTNRAGLRLVKASFLSMSIFPKPIGSMSVVVCALWLSACHSPEDYLQRGNQYFEQGKYDDAVIQYEKAIQRSDKYGPAYYRLGLAELRRNHPVLAYRALRFAVQQMPDDHDAVARLGDVSIGLYSGLASHPALLYDQATGASKRLLGVNPTDFDGNMLEGAIALIEKKPADAIGYLQKAVAARPADLMAKVGLARAMVENGQTEEGLGYARGVVQSDPSYAAAYDFLYWQYKRLGRMQDAENTLKLKVTNNPKESRYVMQLAAHYAEAQKQDQVASTLQILLDHPADFPNARVLVGDFYNAVGRPQDAIRYFAAGAEAGAGESNVYRIRMARTLAAEGQLQAAEQELDQVLKNNPQEREAKAVRALIWIEEGKPENLDHAVAELRAQLKQTAADAPFHFEIGTALDKKGDAAGARREWEIAAGQSPTYVLPRVALAQMDLAQGKAQEELVLAQELMSMAPGRLDTRLLYVAGLTQAARYSEARAELGRLASQYPQSVEVKVRSGLLALAEQNYRDAEDIFRELQGSSPGDLQVLTGLAQAYAGEKEPVKAIQLLEDELKRTPASLPLRETLAAVEALFGRYDQAIEDYKRVAEAVPNNEGVRVSLARVYAAKNDLGATITELKKALDLNPQSALTNVYLAEEYTEAGRLPEAKAACRRALLLEPENARAQNDLAYVMAESGENLDQALVYAQRAQQSAADNSLKSSYSDTLAWIYLKKDRKDDALRIFRGLAEAYPRNATFRYHYGVALYQNGERQRARTELQAALAAHPVSADEPKVRELLAKL